MKQIFPRYDKKLTQSLLTDLRAGSIEARDKIAELNARLVLKIAHRFIPSYLDSCEDLEDVALRSLIERLESIRKGKTVLRDDNIGAYLNKTTVFRLQDFLRKKQRDYKNSKNLVRLLKISQQAIVHNQAIYNLIKEEILTSDVFTDQDKTYISLKIDGYSDVEVAKHLSTSKSNITWIKNRIRPKLKDFL